MESLPLSPKDRDEIIMQLLEQVGLSHLAHKYFHELSGGMKQLVSLCRAFAYQPDIILMDEPFSALDYSMRMKSSKLLLDMRQTNPKTTLFVSHDVDEAIFLSDEIIILSPRPSTIKTVISIDLPRPRTFDMITSDQFVQIRKKVLDVFEY
jgi:ABC-type nitrate/sulfonate/bicarbonate transport system ATPase subunit